MRHMDSMRTYVSVSVCSCIAIVCKHRGPQMSCIHWILIRKRAPYTADKDRMKMFLFHRSLVWRMRKGLTVTFTVVNIVVLKTITNKNNPKETAQKINFLVVTWFSFRCIRLSLFPFVCNAQKYDDWMKV